MDIEKSDIDEEHADLVVSLQGFEGPIDLLLTLAKEQKVDLCRISILPLAEQYLSYIAEAKKLRLEVAADYLIMAAWLAYLKSRMLLPPKENDTEDEISSAEMSEALRFQLLRLEAMKKAAIDIQNLPQLGTDVFLSGKPEAIKIYNKPVYHLSIQELLTALAAPSRRRKPDSYKISPLTKFYSLEESVVRLKNLLGAFPSWASLQAYLPDFEDGKEDIEVRSAVASTFAAALELVKNGEIKIRQDNSFSPIYIKGGSE
ncbi:MAG: segregation/condensation protein A [Alphaproteobacteria bacterium]|nr:segregation/condensation protein A [Alphaproteobacteria bacterium]MCL2505953.1 segregation/condensation protein A [Alphaproteobacteria bacterium]